MAYAALKKQAHALFEEASFITHIKNKADYSEALSLMDELINDYDYNRSLIELLAISIEQWENRAPEFTAFNDKIASMNSGIEILKLLMHQHNLGVADLPEVGSKSLVSKILHDKRNLTIEHIQGLSKRFNISPNLFL